MDLSITNILDQIIASVPLFKPELAIIIGFIACIFVGLFLEKQLKNSAFATCILTLVITMVLLIDQIGISATGFSGMWLVDKLGTYARILIAISSLITAIFIQQRHKQQNGDIYSVLLAATLGLHVLASTSNWLLAFIGIETVSIASYVMVGYFSKNKAEAEASLKYALFGSVCAAVMLYGLSLIYGLTGDLDFQSAQHLQGLMTAPQTIMIIALLFIFVGLGFKLGFVPLHVWTPDVYQGAPTAITAFLTTVPKIGAVILMTRFYYAMAATDFFFSDLTMWLVVTAAISTMLVGNLAALRQTDIKRLMAYSSIGHTGFLLMAIFAYQDSFSHLLFYVIAYVLMNFAAFIFIDCLEQETGSTDLTRYAGLGKKMPVLFSGFTLVAVALVGLPPTIGFVGKLIVFSATFDLFQSSGDMATLLLLVIGTLTTVISLFFYFKIPFYAFLREAKETDSTEHGQQSTTLLVIAYLLVVLILLFGIFPDWLLNSLSAIN